MNRAFRRLTRRVCKRSGGGEGTWQLQTGLILYATEAASYDGTGAGLWGDERGPHGTSDVGYSHVGINVPTLVPTIYIYGMYKAPRSSLS